MEQYNERIEGLLHEGGLLEDIEYVECTLSACNFTGVTLQNVTFVNCVFEDCALRNVAFRGCSMLNGTFRNCVLLGLDWSAVRRHGARLSLLGRMRSCAVGFNTFIDMEMVKMDFSASTLHDCYFQQCSLKQADFRNCDLKNTAFLDCDLSKADFRDARNYAVNILSNKVARAKFSQPDVIGLLSGFDINIE